MTRPAARSRPPTTSSRCSTRKASRRSSFALEPNRPNVVARLKGNGSKRPLLLMAHTDVVNVDPKKWTHPAVRRDARRRLRLQPRHGRRQGQRRRGADDAADAQAQNVPLDRDVIALFEAGEEGTTRVGIQFMANKHFTRHRRRVLPRRRRRRHARERADEVRVGSDAREDSARDLADRARRRRPRLGAAAVELDRAPVRRRRAKSASGQPPIRAERDDGGVLQAPGHDLDARRGRALSQRAQPRSEGERRRRRVLPRQRAAPRVDAAHLGVAEHVPGRLPRQRDSVGSRRHARRAHAARRGSARRFSRK